LELLACKRAFLLETMAISDAESIPFNVINRIIIMTSVTIYRFKSLYRLQITKFSHDIHFFSLGLHIDLLVLFVYTTRFSSVQPFD